MAGKFDGWTIVFDLDGTLVDTAPDLLGALNHVLSGAGLEPVTLDTIAGMIGHGARAMITMGMAAQGVTAEPARMDALFDQFLAYYEANIAVGSRPFSHAVEALDDLTAQGALLAVCTNKRQSSSDRLLTTLHLADKFAAIVGADSVPERKPHGDHILLTVDRAGGDRSRAIMVGDSRTDERAARNAGLPFIFVPFGYETETAEQIAADRTVSDYSDLVSVLLGLLS
ncbi:HAD-IA family hydrolase [Hyphomonas johnsonii]|uniref:Phosphoglycolate phosphatase n=1 Tax=Hyphomonas johnsonii MHS-2 TaxID=1280950 RepID=A0A059FU91_9PROT|nr:HAD-IA family hydrolase [Hyphomonas johnsonii]KCZ94172.1 phosphoglycolate phosphatase [Hyphomonas johnsonii MHS-2]